MIESEAALEIGKNIGEILALAGAVPAVMAAPVIALLSYGSFLFGKKYERKWESRKEKQRFTPVIETIEEYKDDTNNS